MKTYEEILSLNSIDAMAELGIVYKGGLYKLKTGEQIKDFNEAKALALASLDYGLEPNLRGSASNEQNSGGTKFVVSTGGICEPYECMDVVVASNSGRGAFDYDGAKKILIDTAIRRGADGVIYIGFNERSAVGKTCFGGVETIFETRCWGTMIKLKQ